MTKTCPYIGLAGDAETHTAFPSSLNFCHHASPAGLIAPDHQRETCMSDVYLICPVFLRKNKAPLPGNIRASHSQTGRRRPFNWIAILLVILILIILIFAVLRLLSGEKLISTTDAFIAPTLGSMANTLIEIDTDTQTPPLRPTQTKPDLTNNEAVAQTAQAVSEISASLSLTATFTLTPTRTATPTRTLTPTRTPTPTRTVTPTLTRTRTTTPSATPKPFQRALDTPIGTKQKFIIHQIKSGESLSQYATTYKTSVEAILRVNYALFIPLWIDAFIVIPVDATAAAHLPYFQPYKVTAVGISAEVLAKELGADLNDFIYYNGIKPGEQLKAGDWLIIPRVAPGNLF